MIQLKGSIGGKEVLFETHENPHLDEIGAMFLIETYGTDEFLNKYASQGMIRLGVGGGDFDEHPLPGYERQNSDCTTSLVAKALGVYEEPALEKIIGFITNSDLKGSSGPFDISYLTSLRHQRYNDPEKVARMTIDDLTTFYQAQLQFFTATKEEFQKKAIIDEIEDNGRTLVVASVVSDDSLISKFARSVHGGNAALVIQKQISGNVQIFTNRQSGIVIYDLAQIIRYHEQKLKGEMLITDWKTLSAEGKIDGVPEWFFHHKGQMLLNGSLTAKDVPPTRLNLQKIRKFAQIALDRQKFPISHANECRRGICTSSKREPCEFYPYGLHRCRKIRYEMKNSK